MSDDGGQSYRTIEKGRLKAPSAHDIDTCYGSDFRSKQEIVQVVNARMIGLRNVYKMYLKLKPGFNGKVTIAPSGDITSISIVNSV